MDVRLVKPQGCRWAYCCIPTSGKALKIALHIETVLYSATLLFATDQEYCQDITLLFC